MSDRFWKDPIGVSASVVVFLAAIGLSAGFLSSGASPAAKLSPSAASINEEAKTWNKAIVVNFDDIARVPEKCEKWEPKDLDRVHFYFNDKDKESPTAFGSNMGDNPCDVSIALVERSYRDPAFALDLGKDLGLIDFKPADQAKKIMDLEADPNARRALANKVLGEYANPDLTLSIDKYNGAYDSDVMAANGTTRNVSSVRESTVLTARDRDDKIKHQRRLDCGGQHFRSHDEDDDDDDDDDNPPDRDRDCPSGTVPFEGRCVKRERSHDSDGAGGDESPMKQDVDEHPQGDTEDAPDEEPPPAHRDDSDDDDGDDDSSEEHGSSGNDGAEAEGDSDEESSDESTDKDDEPSAPMS